jgi:beta-lactam-binding protein with PASTA domain
VAVPDVLGKTRPDAESALKAAGLKSSETPSVGSDASKQPDTVIELSALQDGKATKLAAGAKVSQGTEVTLTLNKRAVVIDPVPVPKPVIVVPTPVVHVPNVVGLDLQRAKDELAKAGLRVASPVKQNLDRNKPAKTVLSTEPAPSQTVKPNAEITLTANQGLIQVTCQAAYVARFQVAYLLNGKPQSHDSGDIPVGQTREFTIPLDATQIILNISGIGVLGGSFQQVFAGPVTKRYRAKGTVFGLSVEEY